MRILNIKSFNNEGNRLTLNILFLDTGRKIETLLELWIEINWKWKWKIKINSPSLLISVVFDSKGAATDLSGICKSSCRLSVLLNCWWSVGAVLWSLPYTLVIPVVSLLKKPVHKIRKSITRKKMTAAAIVAKRYEM